MQVPERINVEENTEKTEHTKIHVYVRMYAPVRMYVYVCMHQVDAIISTRTGRRAWFLCFWSYILERKKMILPFFGCFRF